MYPCIANRCNFFIVVRNANYYLLTLLFVLIVFLILSIIGGW